MSTLPDPESMEMTFLPQPKRQTATGTDPLALQPSERRTIDDVLSEITPHLGKTLNTNHAQLNAFHCAIRCMEACLSSRWGDMAVLAMKGVAFTDAIEIVSPVLLVRTDGAKRNLASQSRTELNAMAIRLGHAAIPGDATERARAKILRAATNAAVAADRGLLHILKENLGCVVRTIGEDGNHRKAGRAWDAGMAASALRFRWAGVRIP